MAGRVRRSVLEPSSLGERTTAGLVTMTPVGACLRTGPGSLRDLAIITMLRALLTRAPRAQGIVLDLPEVISSAPAAERIQFVGGDFRASVPSGGDIYVLSHILHDWDDRGAHRILDSCRRAAATGTRLLIMEAVLAEQPGPVMPELLSMHLLVMSGGGERTGDQFRRLLESARWQLGQITPLPGGQSLLSARAS